MLLITRMREYCVPGRPLNRAGLGTTLHYKVIDIINETDYAALTREQAVLDEHDDPVAELNVQTRRLRMDSSASTDSFQRKALSNTISCLRQSIITLNDSTKVAATPPDHFLVQQYTEQLHEAKTEQ